MRPPAIPESPVPVISEADLRKLLRACEGPGFAERRDYAIVRLAIDTGLRRAELASFKYDEAFDNFLLGLRLGDHPQVVVTTTPKPRK